VVESRVCAVNDYTKKTKYSTEELRVGPTSCALSACLVLASQPIRKAGSDSRRFTGFHFNPGAVSVCPLAVEVVH
jgi:hypothetical protein